MLRRTLSLGLLSLAMAVPGCARTQWTAMSDQSYEFDASLESTALQAASEASEIAQTSAAGDIEQVACREGCEVGDGRDGRDGRTGRDGRDGRNAGPQGPQGPQGPNQGPGNDRTIRKPKYGKDGQLPLLSPCMAPQLLEQGPRHRFWPKGRLAKRVDNKINVDGCHPEKERLPWLKALADEENLKSDNKAIKTAAEIKFQEDLADQKIKALKYLGMIGCCAYDKDGSVTAALIAALDDPTPRVRMAAVEVISGEFCGKTYRHCCTCKKEIVEKLADLAWGVDDNAYYKEPMPQIRAAAAAIVCKCCPNFDPCYVPPKEETEAPKEPEKIEEAPKETIPEETVSPPALDPKADGRKTAPSVVRVNEEQSMDLSGFAFASVSEVEDDAPTVSRIPAAHPVPAAQANPSANGSSLRGTIDAVDARNLTVTVRLEKSVVLPAGTRVAQFHRYVLGRLASVVEFEVIQSSEGVCLCRPVGNPDVSRATVGAAVTVYGQ